MMAGMPSYQNFIDGEWVPAASGAVFENRNPASTDDLIGHFAKSSRADAERAIAAALDVFSEWKSIYVDFSGRLQRAQIDTD